MNWFRSLRFKPIRFYVSPLKARGVNRLYLITKGVSWPGVRIERKISSE